MNNADAVLRVEEGGRKAAKSTWRVNVLGGLSVEGEGLIIDRFPTRRAALILIRLALAQGRSVSRDSLAALLWPDEFADATKPRLRQELARLKKALGRAEGIIDSDRLSLRLDGALSVIDLKAAEQLLIRSAIEADKDKKLGLLEALSKYSADLAPGYDEPWIYGPREDWRNRSSQFLLEVAEAHAQAGEYDDAVRFGRRAAENHILNESVQSRYLQLLQKIERHEEARAHFHSLEEKYRQLLGTGTSARLSQWVLPYRKPEPAAFAMPSIGPKIQPFPAAVTELFGRGNELLTVTAQLQPAASPRLVTLSGPGGIGKTELALAVGRKLYDAYDRRVWFVSLSAVENPALIGKVILDSLGIPPAAHEDPIAAGAVALEGAPCLLILDNFEQLVDGGAQIVRRILERCGNAKLLVTTRRKLNIGGEQEHPVGPLLVRSGVDLFLSVARKTRSGFALQDGDLERVSEIVQMLDRMPLSIHLAASRVGVLSLADVERQLSKRFELLISRRQDLEPRHRTLWQTVAWSYEELRPELKSFFADLSVFSGGWTADLAADVLQCPNSVDLLEELREDSLIVAETKNDEMRFDMLLTIKEFALKKQDAKRASAHLRRLGRALVKLAEEASNNLLGENQFWWYERLECEHDNIRHVLKFASEHDRELGLNLASNLWRFWSVHGHHAEAREWLALFLPEGIDPTAQVAIGSFGAARLAHEQGDFPAARHWYERALKIYQVKGENISVSMVEANLGELYSTGGELEMGVRLTEKALADSIQSNSHYMEAICRDQLADFFTRLGRFDEAKREAEITQKMLSDQPDKIAYAYSLLTIAKLQYAVGEVDGAEKTARSALTIHKQYHNRHGVGVASELLARLALAGKSLENAAAYMEESEKNRRAVGDKVGLAHLYLLRSSFAKAKGSPKQADQAEREAIRLFHECGIKEPTWPAQATRLSK